MENTTFMVNGEKMAYRWDIKIIFDSPKGMYVSEATIHSPEDLPEKEVIETAKKGAIEDNGRPRWLPVPTYDDIYNIRYKKYVNDKLVDDVNL